MKKIKLISLLIFAYTINLACTGDINPLEALFNENKLRLLTKKSDCKEQISETLYSGNITIDTFGQIWYSTVYEDTFNILPPWSSDCGCLWTISRCDGSNYCTIFDGLDYGIGEIQFDQKGNTWVMCHQQLLKINKLNMLSIVLDISDMDGSFQSIAVEDNIVWIGGFLIGLYRISDSEIAHYTTMNSILPTNSITQILVDRNNTKWIALWDLQGLLKIENENWTRCFTLNQGIGVMDIRAMTYDIDGILWIGTGWIDSSVTLIKYDGIDFMIENPKDAAGNAIPGTVRHLASDNTGRVYAVSEVSKDLIGYSSSLSIYDNGIWINKFIKYGNDIIRDIETYNNELWVSTCGDEIYKIE